MNTLDLSGKIDAKSIAVYSAIDKAVKELAISYVVVGASARDLVLHYGYGATIKGQRQILILVYKFPIGKRLRLYEIN